MVGFWLVWVAHITGFLLCSLNLASSSAGPGWSLCFGQRSQKNREMKAMVRALERGSCQCHPAAIAGKPGHGVLMLIWRFPKIVVPKLSIYRWIFPIFTIQLWGTPIYGNPISPKWQTWGHHLDPAPSSPRYRTPAQNLVKSVILSGLFKKLLVGKPIFW